MKSIYFIFIFLFCFSVLNSQSVGIGTTTPLPGFMLDVNGNLNSKGVRLNGLGNYLIMVDGQNSNKLFRWQASGGYLRNAYNSLSPFSTKDMFIIDSTGKVGLGTANPTAWLDVNNTATGQIAKFNGGSGMWITLSENGVNRGYIGSFLGSAEDIDFGTTGGNTSGLLHLATNGSSRLSIDPSGNVGIGEAPSSGNRLTVSGGDLVVKENGGARIQINSDLASNLDFFTNNVEKHRITSNGTDLVISRSGGFNADLRLDVDGNFGVGAALVNPVSKLQVYATTDASYTNHGLMVLGNETSANVVYDQNEILARNNGSASDLFIQNDGGNLLLCAQEGGAVGIGVGSAANLPAGSLLAVDGKITCEEVLVKMSENWPDYVFDEKYNLKPLHEVRDFIERNKHLPGIPRATEVEQNGLELAKMQKLMMEKIEELTLYIIQLENKISNLEQSSLKK
jgi:hypothetical protein